eukprot:3547394-Lingulodinium_polyedra.AAC.1
MTSTFGSPGPKPLATSAIPHSPTCYTRSSPSRCGICRSCARMSRSVSQLWICLPQRSRRGQRQTRGSAGLGRGARR